MKPSVLLAESVTPDGAKITLHERDGRYAIRVGGRELMNSAVPASELLLAEQGLGGKRKPKKILIGGLGLGFTLRRVLELADADASVTVVELLPAVVEWNRTHLAKLNGDCLADPRVTVKVENVRTHLAAAAPEAYDAVLLDVDNGPAAMVSEDNMKLYSERGLNRLRAMLPRGGRAVVWSASIDVRFTSRMQRAGFVVETVRAKTHKGAHCSAYAIFVGDKPLTHEIASRVASPNPAHGGAVAARENPDAGAPGGPAAVRAARRAKRANPFEAAKKPPRLWRPRGA